ncbi:unknown [Corallococcus sp. CAG:1435]|nr:unknown [Corallococcus sp. CAG:1435]
MSRVLAFFLGMIFGIVCLLGSLGLGVYLAVTKVTPADISQETAVLGDLANMSLLDIYKNLSTLYSQKIGVADENGKYYSLGDLCTQYNIDSQNLFGVSLSDDLLEVPVFEFFSATTDSQGNNGVQRALKQIKVSAIPSLLNLFVKNEDGSAIVNDNVMEELSNYNIVELMTKEQGIAYVFENITFSQLLPENFPSDPNGDNALMWAVGQSSVGKLYTALGSNDSLFLQLKEGGALETLGQMEVTDLLGSEAGTLSSLFGDTLVVDLVGENGEINVDDIINYTYVGSLLGCIRNEITDVSGYHVLASSPNGDVLYGIIDGKDSLVKEEDGKYYEAELTCTEQHDVHGYDCYGFVWYNSSVLPSDHPCTPDEELIKDGLHHSKVSSLYGAFVNLRIADITGGSFDAILDKVKDLTIGEIVNGEVSGILANFADMTVGELLEGGLEKMYLGNFLGYTRTQTDATQVTGVATLDDGTKVGFANGNTVMSDDGETWYLAKSVCEQQHPHTRDCYIYIWMNGNAQADGVMAKLADKKINSLGDISAMLQDFTLADVLGEDNLTGIFRELANVPIGDIANQIDSIYIGTVLEYTRKQVADISGYTAVDDVADVLQNNGEFVRKDGDVWYEAKLDCTESHVHNSDCYGFVWYTDETCVQAVSGLEAMLSNATINTIGDRLKLENFTLAKLGIGGDNNILAYLQDVPLSEIDTQLNTMKLGVALGYTLNNENVWVDGEGNPVKGINAKIAEMSIQDFGSGNGITEITNTLTIGDLMDSGMIVLDEDKKYKLNIIFCNENELSFTESNGLVPYTYHCNIVDFITYQNNGHEDATAKEFYDKFTHNNECAAQWQNMCLTEFIDSLLNAF